MTNYDQHLTDANRLINAAQTPSPAVAGEHPLLLLRHNEAPAIAAPAPSMLEHALWLITPPPAGPGFSIFPLQPRDKRPFKGSAGCKDASRVPSQVREWWRVTPEANIGIATGPVSGILVIDVDGQEGELNLAALGDMPNTLTARTPGKIENAMWQGAGRHLYFVYPEGSGITIGQAHVAPHIDHRGDGGYVVAAPSVHPDGTGSYAWVLQDGLALALAQCPPVILERLRAPKRSRLTAPASLASAPSSAASSVPSATPSIDSALEGSRSLSEHVQALIDAQPGTKHETLVRASYAHACAAHEAGEDQQQAHARISRELIDALAMNTRSEVDSWDGARATVASAIEKAYARPAPFRLQSFELEFNEDALARRFAKLYGPVVGGASTGVVFYCPEASAWYKWDGKRWQQIPGKGAAPTELVSVMLIELEASLRARDEAKLADAVKSKKTAGTMGAILRLAQRLMPVSRKALDQKPELLNCQNGTVDLRTGQIKQHDPTDLITCCTPFPYEPSAPCPRYLEALEQSHPRAGSSPSLVIEYLRVRLGSMLQGSPIEGFTLLHGNGFDGKSTQGNALQRVLGPDYVAPINERVITLSANREHSAFAGSVIGRARVMFCDELKQGATLDMGLIKSLTGYTLIQAQTGFHETPGSIKPGAKLLISTNHKPRISSQDDGTRRRVVVVPYETNLQLAYGISADTTFVDHLVAAEGSGILAWLVSGCRDWFRNNRRYPSCAEVELASAQLLADGDALREFTAMLVRRPGATTTTTTMYKAYLAAAYDDEGDRPMTKRSFNNAMEERGFKRQRRGDLRADTWLDVELPSTQSGQSAWANRRPS